MTWAQAIARRLADVMARGQNVYAAVRADKDRCALAPVARETGADRGDRPPCPAAVGRLLDHGIKVPGGEPATAALVAAPAPDPCPGRGVIPGHIHIAVAARGNEVPVTIVTGTVRPE